MYELDTYVFDKKYWSGFEGILFLIMSDATFGDDEKKEFKNIYNDAFREAMFIEKRNKTYNTIHEEALDLLYRYECDKDIIQKYISICEIYKTYFDIMENITPYDFISWAINRKSINVPQQFIDWKNEQDALRNNMPVLQQANNSRKDYGFIDHILAMADNGKTREEIARYLKSKGFPRTVIGALTAEKWAVVADKTLMKWADNLCPPEPDK